MRALICEREGGPEGLRLVELPMPRPGPGEALVRVKAAALNFFDTLLIRGKYQQKAEMPFSPCAEFSGLVEKAEGLAPGTRVMGFMGWGAAREYVCLPEASLVVLPEGVSERAAAGLAVTYGTAIHALKTRAGLKSGETLAVLGAAGGAGQAAVEIGRLMGARVIACASSAEKLAAAARLGADGLVDYSSGDLKEQLKALTQGKGVDVVYDPVGGDLAEPALRATGWGGRYLVIGFASGEIPKIPANLLLVKGSSLTGVHWGEHARREPGLLRDELLELVALVAAGALSPQVHGSFPLAEWQLAFGALESRQAQGKVLLVP